MYEDLSDLSQNPNHIWVCGSTAPTPIKHSFLSVRYVDADGNVLGTYFTYCDIGAAYEVPSPALDGMSAAEPLPTGVLQQSTFMDVLCIPHMHTPGDAATCHSAQVCLTCQQVLAERLTHADDNGDYRCDHCGKLSIDVNGDGYLNIADVNDILCCLSGAVDISGFAYDIDENGILNINDLNELLIALSKIA